MGLSTAKLIGAGVGLLGVLAFVLIAFHWKHTMTERGARLAAICTATRSASANPKMACGNVVVQIDELGKSIVTLKGALADQNAKVAALGRQTAEQQTEAAKAVRNAAGRAKAAQATSERLTASSRAGGAVAKPCEPSKALQEAWQ